MRQWIAIFGVLVGAVLLGACSQQDESTPLPPPVKMTAEAVGHYCSMNVLEHAGPKAQIHLKGMPQPIWFSQVRDAIVFLRSPEELYEPRVTYVHDMAKAESWAHPGDGAWLDAQKAVFVIASTKTGGMGANEAIPFGTRAAADRFIAQHGGRAVNLSEIPDSYVLGTADAAVVAGQSTEAAR